MLQCHARSGLRIPHLGRARTLPISFTKPCLALTHREHPATSRTHDSRALTKQGRTRSLRHTVCHLLNSSTHQEVPSRTSTITGPHLTFPTSDIATLPAQASPGALPSLSHVPTTRQTRSIGRTSDAPTAEERVRNEGESLAPTYPHQRNQGCEGRRLKTYYPPATADRKSW